MRVIVALAFVFVTAFTATATSSASITETTDHVVKITLDSRHGGWGHQHYAGTVERSGTGFILDGETVGNAKVSALLDAIRSRASRVPVDQIANLSEYVIGQCASSVSSEFGSQMQDKAFSAGAMSACQTGAKDFVTKYLSPDNLSFHTDDYPEEAVVITFDDGHTVSVLSKSQNAFMLPWRIVGHSFQGLVYDTALARCIVALFGKKDVNAQRLSADALAAAYAESLHIEPPTSLPSPPAAAPNTPLQSAMEAANVYAVWSEPNDSTGRISGEIGSSRWGGIRSSFDCPMPTDATTAVNCLAVAVDHGDKLAAIPWIRAVSLRPQLQVETVNADFAADDIRRLSRLSSTRPDIADLMDVVDRSGIVFWIVPADHQNIDGISTWVLLPDQRLILSEYNPGPLIAAAGLDQSLLGGTGWARLVGALFSPEGKLIGPTASQTKAAQLTDVSSIVIQSRNNGRTTQTAITADANGGFHEGARAVSAAAISQLLSAIHRQVSLPLASTSLSEGSTLLRACAQITRQQLGAYASSSRGARTLFEGRCRDAHYLATFLQDYNNSSDGLILDDGFDGQVQLTITYNSGKTLKVSSDSHLAYMIPWSVTGIDVPRTSYDPALGQAIAAIVDQSDPNRARLDGSILPQQYGTDIRQKLYQYAGHPADLPSAAILVPVLGQYASAQGYLLKNLVYDRGADSVIGMLSAPLWHSHVWVQFQCPVSTTKQGLPGTLAPSIALGTRLAGIAWIRRALERPELSVMAYPWKSLQQYPYAEDSVADYFDNWPDSVPGLSAADAHKISRSPGVAWFALEQTQSVELSIVAGRFSSLWMLQPNGTAILGLYTLGLPEYIGINGKAPSIGEGIQRYAGVFVDTTGSVHP